LANNTRGDSLVDPSHDLLLLAAAAYSRAGATDSALAMVDRVLTSFPERADSYASNPPWFFKNLRDDPRYVALVNQHR
jgi:hypothetical protein